VDLCNKAPNFWQQPAMGFSTYMMAPGCCLVPYDGLTPEAACLAEPAGVAYDMVKTAGIALGETVAVVGPGPIGLMAVALALRSGASEVWCIGRGHSAQRLKVAAAMGARVYPWDKSLGEAEDLHRKFNHVLLTAPVQHLPECLNLLSYGGELTYVGIGVGDGHVSFDANDFHFRKLQLRASFASPAIYYPHVLTLLAGKVLDANLLVSHRFPLKQIDQAMRLCRDKKDTAVKVVVLPDGENERD
jgi:L-iditol 2-dehydrogenase